MKKKLNNEYLDSFLDNIWAEQGLAKNTLLSYEHDINSFLTFIDNKKKQTCDLFCHRLFAF